MAKQTIKKFEKLIVSRPAKMKYDDYKKERKLQQKRLKERLNGVIVWRSKCLPEQDEKGNIIYRGKTEGTLRGSIESLRVK